MIHYYMEGNLHGQIYMVKFVKVLEKVFPLLFLYESYWFIGFIPITYIYYPNLAVYREASTIFGIIAFILTFLVIAVGVFNIRSVKQVGMIFLCYQPIKLILDLTGTTYESKYLNNFIFYSLNFLTIFICLGVAVIIIKNKENGLAFHTNISKFLIRCIPITLISVFIPILENLAVRHLLNQSLPYSAEEIFNTIVLIMSVSSAVLTVMLGVFVQAVGATVECDYKFISVKALKPLVFSVLCSVGIIIIWRLILL